MNLEETEEFTLHWTKAQAAVAAYIATLIPDFHQAEDVLHQVVLHATAKIRTIRPQPTFRSWAMGVARLEILKLRTRCATDRHHFHPELAELLITTHSELADEFESRRSALIHCVRQLKNRSQRILQLCYGDQLKPAAAAAQLKISPGAARALLHRVHQSLRACIERRLSRQGLRETR